MYMSDVMDTISDVTCTCTCDVFVVRRSCDNREVCLHEWVELSVAYLERNATLTCVFNLTFRGSGLKRR